MAFSWFDVHSFFQDGSGSTSAGRAKGAAALSLLVERLYAGTVKLPLGDNVDKILLNGSMESPISQNSSVNSPHPSPHLPPGASPTTPEDSSTPIVAYCLPYRENDETGCFLKVSAADPGSDVRFRLTSTAGEHLETVLHVPSGDPSTGMYLPLPHSIRFQANFTGTVEYDGKPSRSWTVTNWDPESKTRFVHERDLPGEVLRKVYFMYVNLHNQKPATFKYYVDSVLQQ